VKKSLGWYATTVQTGAADFVCFDQGYGETQLRAA